MKLTERRSNGKLTTWIYEDESLRSVEAAAGRIAYAAALEGFEPKYIALRDLEHSADEGSDSRELRAAISSFFFQMPVRTRFWPRWRRSPAIGCFCPGNTGMSEWVLQLILKHSGFPSPCRRSG